MSNFRCKKAISDMVLRNLDELCVDNLHDSKLFQEGALKMLRHRTYERNSKAREECVKRKGYKCSICGFDFEKVYGEIGKGFVEVHHTSFISSFEGKERLTDIEYDLIPVCSNCHSMLHRRLDGKYLTSNELKQTLMHTN